MTGGEAEDPDLDQEIVGGLGQGPEGPVLETAHIDLDQEIVGGPGLGPGDHHPDLKDLGDLDQDLNPQSQNDPAQVQDQSPPGNLNFSKSISCTNSRLSQFR